MASRMATVASATCCSVYAPLLSRSSPALTASARAVARHGAARVLAVDDLDVVERAVLLEVEVQRHRRGNGVGLGGPLELERSGAGVAVVELHAVEQRLIRAALRHLRHVRAVIGGQRGIGHGQIEVAHGELAGLGLGSIGVVDGAIVHRLDVIELRAHGPRGRGKLDLAGLLGLELEGRHGPGAAVEILLPLFWKEMFTDCLPSTKLVVTFERSSMEAV